MNKDKLIELIYSKSWNKSINPRFEKRFYDRNGGISEEIKLLNFEYENTREIDLYNSLINGSVSCYGIKDEIDFKEYIFHIEENYNFDEINDFNILKKQSNLFVNLEDVLFSNLSDQKQKWILYSSIDLIEVFIIHTDNTHSYLSYDIQD